MFPQRENQAIAGIYDLLEIILEKLNRIEHNQEKDRISRAFGGAYNVNHQPIDALSRARPELQSRNNYRHTSSLLSAPDLVQNQTCSVLIPNNSPSASKPTEESSSGEDNENNIKMQRGLEKENDDVEQRKYQISLGQHAEGQQKQVDPSVALGRKEKRKLQQEDVGSKRQQKPKKCRQEDTNDDEEHESTKEMLFTEEMLFVEEEETDEEEESLRKKLETTLKKKKSRREQKARLQQEQEDARLHKEQEDRLRKEEQDKLQRERNTTLKYSRSKQGMKETSKATPNGEDTLLEGEIALNSTTRSSQKEKRVVVQTEQMKRRRELQTLTRRRRSVIVKKGQQANTGSKIIV
jgi:hypothetical protein